MPTHVALIRGINVGGHNRVAMADLRAVVTSLAHSDVATYIQSGNVVFTSTQTDTTAIAAALERAIAESLSARPKVVVLSAGRTTRPGLGPAGRDRVSHGPQLGHRDQATGHVPGVTDCLREGSRNLARSRGYLT